MAESEKSPPTPPALSPSKPWSDTWNPCWNQVDDFTGWVTTWDEAQQVRQKFEIVSSLRFVGNKKTRNFGHLGSQVQDAVGRFIRFSDVKEGIVNCEGSPFVILGKYTLECMFGRDKNKASKNKAAEERDRELKGDHPSPRKKRSRVKKSKKKGCPAQIVMKEVILFPQSKSSNIKKKAVRDRISKEIKEALSSGEVFESEHRIYIKLPSPSSHQNTHSQGPLVGFLNPLDKRLREKIQELVGHGVSNTKEMKKHLKIFVETTLFPNAAKRPETTNTAYFPRDNTIRNHIYAARMRLRYVKENMCAPESYSRGHDDTIPHYLRNRPASFIQHCMRKLELADTIPQTNIKRVSSNTFEVKSDNEGKPTYVVELLTHGPPSCTCGDWRWNQMPCKHLFAIMREYPEKTWESLPAIFREASHITLDQEAATFLQEADHQLTDPPLDQHDSIDQDQGGNLQELPERVVPSSVNQVAIRCRERIALLRDMTYTCHDLSLLATMEEKLGDIVGLLKQDGSLAELNPPSTNYQGPS